MIIQEKSECPIPHSGVLTEMQLINPMVANSTGFYEAEILMKPLPVYDDARFSDLSCLFRIIKACPGLKRIFKTVLQYRENSTSPFD